MEGKLKSDVELPDFLIYALGVIARSDHYHIDRRYSTPANFAQDVLEYADLDTEDVEIDRAQQLAFSKYRSERRGMPPMPEKAQAASTGTGDSLVDAVNEMYGSGSPAPVMSDVEKVKMGNGLMFWVGIFAISAAIFNKFDWAWALAFVGCMVCATSLIAIVNANSQSGAGQSDPGI